MFTPLSWLERCPTYKDQLNQMDEKNIRTYGFLGYPCLQAADILIYKADFVPVGEDQLPHIEMTREIARRFNFLYDEVFPEPQPLLTKAKVLPGLDGRKMSKSYNNTIPLFVPEKKLRKMIMKIKTNSMPPEAPKDPETCTLFQIFQAFAEPDETNALRQRYAEGIGWGEMKQYLFEYLNDHLKAPRDRYADLIEHPQDIEKILQEGASKAREYSRPFLRQIRQAIGVAALA